MDTWLAVSIVVLIVWAAGTIFLEPPGWFHGLLTLGVFLLIMRVVARDTPASPKAVGDQKKRRR